MPTFAKIKPGRVSVFDIAIGTVLAAGGVALTTGLTASPGRHGGVLAALAVLTMTLPVIWRRRAPVAVALVLGLGALLNSFAIGPMVRCGPCLPALLICAFSLGRWAPTLGWRRVGFAIGWLFVSAVVQCATDPNLELGVLVALVPMILALYVAGRLLASRTEMVTRLRNNNEQLSRQREQIAQLAIQADRARIVDGLNESLSSRISAMASAAETGRRALGDSSGATEAADAEQVFATIGRRGRETLQHMRQMVGTLLETAAPTQPQPTLAQLDQLARQTNVRVHVSGEPRALPAGVELSGYRTIEHLLDAFGQGQSGDVDVYVDFGPDTLTLTVRGPAAAVADQQTALAAAQARIAMHNGSLSSARPDGSWEATAQLPLAAYV